MWPSCCVKKQRADFVSIGRHLSVIIMRYRTILKRCSISFFIGCLMTVLSLLFFIIPRIGPSTLIAVFVIPFRMIASKIAPDMESGEIAFWGLIVAWWTLVSFVLLFVICPLFGRISRRNGADSSDQTGLAEQTKPPEPP